MSGAQVVERPKYVTIISQFYHTRHIFVVETPAEDAEYYEKARAMIANLEAYKRVGTYAEGKEIAYGDMAEKYFKGASRRYNVNDAGDIYLIPCWSIVQAMANAREYWLDTKRESYGYKKKVVTEAIQKCHRWDDIKSIIGKYFVIL